MDESYKTLVRQIRDRVRKFMQRADTRDLNLLVQNLEDRGCRVALFGGTIRDLMLQRAPRYPRDIDLVVEAGDVDCFFPLLMQAVVRRTRFGGLSPLHVALHGRRMVSPRHVGFSAHSGGANI